MLCEVIAQDFLDEVPDHQAQQQDEPERFDAFGFFEEGLVDDDGVLEKAEVHLHAVLRLVGTLDGGPVEPAGLTGRGHVAEQDKASCPFARTGNGFAVLAQAQMDAVAVSAHFARPALFGTPARVDRLGPHFGLYGVAGIPVLAQQSRGMALRVGRAGEGFAQCGFGEFGEGFFFGGELFFEFARAAFVVGVTVRYATAACATL